jgi:hypothetical protein
MMSYIHRKTMLHLNNLLAQLLVLNDTSHDTNRFGSIIAFEKDLISRCRAASFWPARQIPKMETRHNCYNAFQMNFNIIVAQRRKIWMTFFSLLLGQWFFSCSRVLRWCVRAPFVSKMHKTQCSRIYWMHVEQLWLFILLVSIAVLKFHCDCMVDILSSWYTRTSTLSFPFGEQGSHLHLVVRRNPLRRLLSEPRTLLLLGLLLVIGFSNTHFRLLRWQLSLVRLPKDAKW